MSKQDNLTDFLVDVADAIREKKGTTEKINPQNFSEEIRSIESGQVTEVEEKDINFYDYDGTLLFSYTIPEAQALTELPTPKGHSGLIFDGWNWDYEEVIALDYPMDIGATYRTDDGKTRLYLKVDYEDGVDITLTFKQAVANGVIIDFGDGTDSMSYESLTPAITHHYDRGSYILTMQVVGTAELILETTNSYYNILGNKDGRSSNILTKVELGDRTYIGSYAFLSCANLEVLTTHSYRELGWTSTFADCISLKCVVYPKGCKYIFSAEGHARNQALRTICLPITMTDVNSSFQYCPNMKTIHFPNSTPLKGFNSYTGLVEFRIPIATKTVSPSFFRQCYHLRKIENLELLDKASATGYLVSDCYALKSINIPAHWKYIGAHDFFNCYSLKDITLPPHIESIGVYAFFGCACLKYDFSKSDVIPSLANTSVFKRDNPDKRIIVPDNLYEEWIAATNWSTYADIIVKASEYQPNNE